MEPKLKTRTVSFRVPENIINDIEKEAKVKLVSTNVLINQILSQYVTWDKYEQRMRMFPVAQDILHYILNGLDELERKNAIETTYNCIRDWALLSRKKFDLHTCLEVLEDYCRIVGISVEENVSEGFRSYIIRHNMGTKVSTFIEELATKIFWDIVKIKVNVHSTNSTVIIKLLSRLD